MPGKFSPKPRRRAYALVSDDVRARSETRYEPAPETTNFYGHTRSPSLVAPYHSLVSRTHTAGCRGLGYGIKAEVVKTKACKRWSST